MGSFLDIFGGGNQNPPVPPQLRYQTFDNNQALANLPGQLGSANQGLFNSYMGLASPYAAQQQGLLNQYAPQNAALETSIMQQNLPGMAAAQRSAAQAGDPTGFALREQLGNTLSQNLASNGGLSPAELFQTQQDLRSGQSRLGASGQGISDLFDEARFLGNTRFGRAQAQQSQARGFLGLRQPGEQAANSTLGLNAPNTSGLLQQMTPGQVISGDMAHNESVNAKRAALNAGMMSAYNNRPASSSDLGGYLGMAGGLVGTAAGAYFGESPQAAMMGGQMGSSMGSNVGNMFGGSDPGGYYTQQANRGQGGGGMMGGMGGLMSMFGGGGGIGGGYGDATGFGGGVQSEQINPWMN